ncbi:MAG: hypothetical protein ACE5GA_00705 [Candidatus Zixiibacteriota bacterium]
MHSAPRKLLISSTVSAACVALMLCACSTTIERRAPYFGKVISVDTMFSLDSAYLDSQLVDLSNANAMLIYDRQFDGLFDDSSAVFGDESGEFTGTLFYDSPFNVRANRLRRSVRLLIPEVGIDTHLSVDIYLSEQGEGAAYYLNDWGTLRAADTSFSLPQARSKSDSSGGR